MHGSSHVIWHNSVSPQPCLEYKWIGFLVGFDFTVWRWGEEKGVVDFSLPAWCLNSAKWMWQWGPWAATDSLGLAVWPCMCVCLRVRLHVPPCPCADKRKEVEHIWDDSWTLLTQGRDPSDCYTHASTGHYNLLPTSSCMIKITWKILIRAVVTGSNSIHREQ